MLRANDMRRKITAELKGKSETEQIRIIEGYVRDWPSNVRGEYVEMRRHLVRRLEKLQTSSTRDRLERRSFWTTRSSSPRPAT